MNKIYYFKNVRFYTPVANTVAPGLKGSVQGLMGTAGGIFGGLGNFANNVWNGTSGGYNGTPQINSQGGAGNENMNKPVSQTGGGQTQGVLSSLVGGGQTMAGGNGTAASGGYAGPVASNPNYTASTPPPVSTVPQGGGTPGNSIMPPGGYSSPGQTSVGVNGNVTAQNQNNPNAMPINPNSGGVAPQGIPGAFQTILNNQANTQPYTSTGNAVSYLQGQAQGQNPANTNINTLTGLGQTPSPQVQGAINNLSQFQQGGGKLLNEIQSDPGLAASVSTGIASQVGQQLGTTESALTQAAQNALTQQGQQINAANAAGGQQLTGQSQQIGAANNAGTIGNAAQSNQITAQQNAASNLLNSLAQQGYVIINKTTGQPVSTQGALSAAFSGGQTGAAETAGGNTFAMNQANVAAKGIQGTIQQFLTANPTINSNTSTLANAAQQWLSGQQLGDPNYQTLFNDINEYISTLAPILGVGGDTTNLKTQIAQGFINAQASGQSISQVLNNISTLADNKLANLTSAGQGGGQIAGGTPTGSTPSSFGTSW